MKISTKSIDAFFFYAVLIDILFLPYIRTLGVTLSMLLVPLWFLIAVKRVSFDYEDLLSLLAIFLALASFLIGIAVYSNGIFLRDGSLSSPSTAFLANTVIIIFLFLYFIFFKRMIIRYSFNIDKVMWFYILFLSILNTVYFYDQALFFQVRAFWTLNNNVIEVVNLLGMNRFTSTFSDPNNFAVISNAVLAFILMDETIKKSYKLLLIPLVFYLLVGSMSSTGFILFAVVLIVFFIKNNFYASKSIKSIFNNFLLTFLVILIFTFVFIYISQTSIGAEAFERVGNSSLDSRIGIWDNVININKFLSSTLYGDGGLVIMDNRVINPHTGHLHLIYSYGFIFYLIFIFIFFRKRKSHSYFHHLFLFCIFVGFTVNVGVYELRFVGVMSILTATFYMQKYNNKGSINSENRSYSGRI